MGSGFELRARVGSRAEMVGTLSRRGWEMKSKTSRQTEIGVQLKRRNSQVGVGRMVGASGSGAVRCIS